MGRGSRSLCKTRINILIIVVAALPLVAKRASREWKFRCVALVEVRRARSCPVLAWWYVGTAEVSTYLISTNVWNVLFPTIHASVRSNCVSIERILALFLEPHHTIDVTIAVPQLAKLAKAAWRVGRASCIRIHLNCLSYRSLSWQWRRRFGSRKGIAGLLWVVRRVLTNRRRSGRSVSAVCLTLRSRGPSSILIVGPWWRYCSVIAATSISRWWPPSAASHHTSCCHSAHCTTHHPVIHWRPPIRSWRTVASSAGRSITSPIPSSAIRWWPVSPSPWGVTTSPSVRHPSASPTHGRVGILAI